MKLEKTRNTRLRQDMHTEVNIRKMEPWSLFKIHENGRIPQALLKIETRALGEGSPESGAGRREEEVQSSPQGQEEVGKCFAAETKEEGIPSSGLSGWLKATEKLGQRKTTIKLLIV